MMVCEKSLRAPRALREPSLKNITRNEIPLNEEDSIRRLVAPFEDRFDMNIS